jgi:hypothetical protein
MFRSLWGNPTDCFPDLSPAGSLVSGGNGRLVTQAIRRTSQEIGETKDGERTLGPFGDSRCEVLATALEEGVDDCCCVCWHAATVPAHRLGFNYVLTTMC